LPTLLITLIVSGLQAMLTACERELTHIDICISLNKSKCIHFGPRFEVPCADLVSAVYQMD